MKYQVVQPYHASFSCPAEGLVYACGFIDEDGPLDMLRDTSNNLYKSHFNLLLLSGDYSVFSEEIRQVADKLFCALQGCYPLVVFNSDSGTAVYLTPVQYLAQRPRAKRIKG